MTEDMEKRMKEFNALMAGMHSIVNPKEKPGKKGLDTSTGSGKGKSNLLVLKGA